MSTNSLSTSKPVKPYKGLAMEGTIAKWYAQNTGRASEQKQILKRTQPSLPDRGNILEVAPGPGFLSIEYARLGKYKVTALEISKTFIEIARENARKASVNVEFRHGNASRMPFDSNGFDFIICVAAFKNFSQPVEALREMYRVLKPGGTACIIDLRRDAPLEKINHHIKHELHLSGLNAFITRWVFKTTLLKNAYTKAEITDLAAQTKFSKLRIDEDALGMDIWLEK
jgi:ubiquinone/menaquinone biosynthesis C-methylase UbiE